MKERNYIVIAAFVFIALTAGCVIAAAWHSSRQLGLAVAAAFFGYASYVCASTLNDNPDE